MKIYTVYSKEDDMTFIMEQSENTLEVKGFYFGKPDEEANERFYGKTLAIVE